MYAAAVVAAAAAAAAAPPATTYAGAWVRVPVTGPLCDVTRAPFNAVGDGVADDTAAIQHALDVCAGAAGGTTLLPAGRVFLASALAARGAAGAALVVDGTLRFSNDTAAWPAGKPCLALSGRSMALVGGGVVDGQGAAWWPHRAAFRPGLVNVQGSSELLVANLTFIDSPNHSLELYAGNTEVVGVTIRAPPSTDPVAPSHNTDGIDVHGDFFYIHNTDIDTGDDNVAIHSSHVLIEDCRFGNGHGASIGSIGGATALENITVRGVTFDGTTAGVRIKIDSKDTTGYIRDVTYANLTMRGVGETVTVCFFYDVDGACNWPGTADASATVSLQLQNVVIADITSANAATAGQLTCALHARCSGVTLRDIVHTGTPPKAWACANAGAAAPAGSVPALPAACTA
jgi:polygalacturonase